jgi:hypothetical protein
MWQCFTNAAKADRINLFSLVEWLNHTIFILYFANVASFYGFLYIQAGVFDMR